ncbi:uncharacterized protein LOC141898885 [Tubulanus polymorphus]|uniref:uncharacterized protein LOC141898885 n=1 Tax=Tubulanus polymorphus TaxID=672921 RepID=UPI003DA5A505
MDIGCTQALPLFDSECDLSDNEADDDTQPIGKLTVPAQQGIADLFFSIYEGENIIGRDPACKIYIPSAVLSREHACIEVQGGVHMIYDKGSLNKTKRGKLTLSKDVRYELKDGDEIFFGNISSVYNKVSKDNKSDRAEEADTSLIFDGETQGYDYDIFNQPTQACRPPNSKLKDTDEDDEMDDEATKENINNVSSMSDIFDQSTQLCASNTVASDDETDDDETTTNIFCEPTLAIDLINESPSERNKAGSPIMSTDASTQILSSLSACAPTQILSPTANAQTLLLSSPSASAPTQILSPSATSFSACASTLVLSPSTSDTQILPVSPICQRNSSPLKSALKSQNEKATMLKKVIKFGIEDMACENYDDDDDDDDPDRTLDPAEEVKYDGTDQENAANRCSKSGEEPTQAVVFDEPTQVVTFEEPTQAVAFDEPTQAMGLDEPTQAVTFEEPTQAVAFDEPTQAMGLDEPTQVVTFDEPTQAVTFDEPTQAMGLDEPTQAVTFEEPTQAVAFDEPTQAMGLDEPTQVVTFEEPTQAVAFDEPTQAMGMNEPTQVVTFDEPTQAMGLDEPTEAVTFEEQTQAVTFDEPTQAMGLDEPTQAMKLNESTLTLELEPMQPMELDEPTQPMELEEPTQPMELNEPTHPMELEESKVKVGVVAGVKPRGGRRKQKINETKSVSLDESTQPMRLNEPTQPMGIDEPTQPMGIDEPTQPLELEKSKVKLGVVAGVKSRGGRRKQKINETKSVSLDEPTQPMGIDEPTQPMGLDEPTQPMGLDEPTQPMGLDEPTQLLRLDEPKAEVGNVTDVKSRGGRRIQKASKNVDYDTEAKVKVETQRKARKGKQMKTHEADQNASELEEVRTRVGSGIETAVEPDVPTAQVIKKSSDKSKSKILDKNQQFIEHKVKAISRELDLPVEGTTVTNGKGKGKGKRKTKKPDTPDIEISNKKDTSELSLAEVPMDESMIKDSEKVTTVRGRRSSRKSVVPSVSCSKGSSEKDVKPDNISSAEVPLSAELNDQKTVSNTQGRGTRSTRKSVMPSSSESEVITKKDMSPDGIGHTEVSSSGDASEQKTVSSTRGRGIRSTRKSVIPSCGESEVMTKKDISPDEIENTEVSLSLDASERKTVTSTMGRGTRGTRKSVKPSSSNAMTQKDVSSDGIENNEKLSVELSEQKTLTSKRGRGTRRATKSLLPSFSQGMIENDGIEKTDLPDELSTGKTVSSNMDREMMAERIPISSVNVQSRIEKDDQDNAELILPPQAVSNLRECRRSDKDKSTMPGESNEQLIVTNSRIKGKGKARKFVSPSPDNSKDLCARENNEVISMSDTSQSMAEKVEVKNTLPAKSTRGRATRTTKKSVLPAISQIVTEKDDQEKDLVLPQAPSNMRVHSQGKDSIVVEDVTDTSKAKGERKPIESESTVPADLNEQKTETNTRAKGRGRTRKLPTTSAASCKEICTEGNAKITVTSDTNSHKKTSVSRRSHEKIHAGMREPDIPRAKRAKKSTEGETSENLENQSPPIRHVVANDKTDNETNEQKAVDVSSGKGKGRGRSKKSVIPPPIDVFEQDTKTAASPKARKKLMSGLVVKVMFTGVVDENGQKIVKELGGELNNSVLECTHLVTDRVRRTVKFLCCLSRGIPIISTAWLEKCKLTGKFIDCTSFLIKDVENEKKYKFDLKHSISVAANCTLLDGYQIHVTKSVKPDPATMKEIIESAGGKRTTMPRKAAEKTVVISCEENIKLCKAAVNADIPVVSAEFILTGILRQQVDVESYPLY